jgi:hypothetical protein
MATIQHIAHCRYCGDLITWITASSDPPETGAPLDASGNISCVLCEVAA